MSRSLAVLAVLSEARQKFGKPRPGTSDISDQAAWVARRVRELQGQTERPPTHDFQKAAAGDRDE